MNQLIDKNKNSGRVFLPEEKKTPRGMTLGDLGQNLAQQDDTKKLAAALFLISFATVLFTLVIFRLLSFFIMPSLFFDLLFIGFPVGAVLGTAFFAADLKSFLKTLWILQLAIIVSIIAVLFAHNFDYLRVHLFDVEVSQLLINIGVFTLLFVPFFVAYGLCEYIGYQVGRKRFSTKMRLVYALNLFGAAGAYFAAHWIVPLVGVIWSILLVLSLLSIASLFISNGKRKVISVLQFLAIVVCMFIPNLESNFLAAYKGKGNLSTDHLAESGFDLVFQKWGRYSLCEIMASPDRSSYYGFYNDFFQWEYHPQYGFFGPSLGAVPIKLIEPGAKIAIIGSGGGRQVRYASVIGHTDITAVEIEPAVIEAVRSEEHLKNQFRNVYDSEGVNIIIAEGRGFLNSIDEKYDLIFLPSVGGYPQMMLEPGNLIRTLEAYETIKEKLSSNGYFAIWYPLGLDSKGVLTQQYVRTLRSLNMSVRAYKNQGEFLILSRPEIQMPLPTPQEITETLAQLLPGSSQAASTDNIANNIRPHEYPVSDDEQFQAVTDDRPFLGGNLRHIFSTRQIIQLYGAGAIVLVIIAILMWFDKSRRGDPVIERRSYGSVKILSLLLGANFLMVEHQVVLTLFQTTFVYHDALMIGAVGFLIFSGIGSLISTQNIAKPFVVISVIAFCISVIFSPWLPQLAQVIMLLPATIATGMFFPALFEKASRNPLGVFAFDAIGAGIGSLLAAVIPLLLGFKFFGYVAAIIFILTVVIDKWFHEIEVVTPVN